MNVHPLAVCAVVGGFLVAPPLSNAIPPAKEVPLRPSVNLRVGIHATFSPLRPSAGGLGLDSAFQVGLMDAGPQLSPTAGVFGQLDWTSRGFVRFAGGARLGGGLLDGCCGSGTHTLMVAIEADIGWAAATRKGESGLFVGPIVASGPSFIPVNAAISYHAIVRDRRARDHLLQLETDFQPVAGHTH